MGLIDAAKKAKLAKKIHILFIEFHKKLYGEPQLKLRKQQDIFLNRHRQKGEWKNRGFPFIEAYETIYKILEGTQGIFDLTMPFIVATIDAIDVELKKGYVFSDPKQTEAFKSTPISIGIKKSFKTNSATPYPKKYSNTGNKDYKELFFKLYNTLDDNLKSILGINKFSSGKSGVGALKIVLQLPTAPTKKENREQLLTSLAEIINFRNKYAAHNTHGIATPPSGYIDVLNKLLEYVKTYSSVIVGLYKTTTKK